jgi:hypothetical protein
VMGYRARKSARSTPSYKPVGVRAAADDCHAACIAGVFCFLAAVFQIGWSLALTQT